MESNNPYKRPIDIISRRLNIDKNRITGVIIDYIIDVVDAINEEKE